MIPKLLKSIPRKVWVGLALFWWGQMFVMGFAGAAVYDWAF